MAFKVRKVVQSKNEVATKINRRKKIKRILKDLIFFKFEMYQRHIRLELSQLEFKWKFSFFFFPFSFFLFFCFIFMPNFESIFSNPSLSVCIFYVPSRSFIRSHITKQLWQRTLGINEEFSWEVVAHSFEDADDSIDLLSCTKRWNSSYWL